MSRTLALLLLIGLLLPQRNAFGQAEATAEAAAPEATAPAEQAAPAKEPTPEAKSAKAKFDELLGQWETQTGEIQRLKQEQSAAQGEVRKKLGEQVVAAQLKVSQLLDKALHAGIEVYKADKEAYPRINSTLLAIAQFYLLGDWTNEGDGGDQYEKAYAVIKKMTDLDAGETWPDLYTWGGVAAYHINEFEAARDFFTKAEAARSLTSTPPNRNPRDPRFQLWEQAQRNLEQLPTLEKAWQVEQTIRAKEAEADDLPRVKFTTNRGDIVLELFENEAPQAVGNMITLVKKGYYDGVTFHRVLGQFMAQGGDPDGTGTGGPGYNIRSEFNQPGARKHFRGSLSMANTGQPNTGGSQFFLTFVPTSMLDGKHTVFGRVIEGMDVVASIRRRNPQAPRAPKPDRIIKAEVLRDRGHDYPFEKLP